MEYLKKNKILLGVFFVTLFAFLYYFLGTSSTPVSVQNQPTMMPGLGSGAPSMPGPGGTGPAPMGGVGMTQTTNTVGTGSQDIVSLLSQIGRTTIDTSLFTDAAWGMLRDFSTPLPNDTPGKTDLFSPIGQTTTVSVPVPVITTKKK